jgi:hypothetical protein
LSYQLGKAAVPSQMTFYFGFTETNTNIDIPTKMSFVVCPAADGSGTCAVQRNIAIEKGEIGHSFFFHASVSQKSEHD